MKKFVLMMGLFSIPGIANAWVASLQCKTENTEKASSLTVVSDDQTMIWNGIKMKIRVLGPEWIVGSNGDTVGTDFEELLVVSLSKKTGEYFVGRFPFEDGIATSAGHCFSPLS